MNNKIYINYLLSLKKETQFAPFEIEWVPLYGRERQVAWVQTPDTDFYDYDKENSIEPGELFLELLHKLTPSIEAYPYTWSINSQKLDLEGYDFHTDQNQRTIEIEPIAYIEALRQLGIPDELPDKTTPYLENKRVSGGHLSKLQLTFEKASPLSTLSLQMFNQNPVELLSLVSERDIAGSSEPIEIDLNNLQAQYQGDTVTLLFGEPIFTKRLTFVLSQDSALSNQFYINKEGEDFTYQAVKEDQQHLASMISKHHHGQSYLTDDIYSNEDIKDWSDARKTSYIKWRDSVIRGG